MDVTNEQNRSLLRHWWKVGAIVVVVILGVLLWLGLAKKNPVAHSPLPKESAVSLTDSGFSPKSLTISQGTSVRWTNNTSSDKASVNSDDYPSNKRFPELNLGQFPRGKSVVHIFTTPGTYTYHDQFHPQRTGTVLVQK